MSLRAFYLASNMAFYLANLLQILPGKSFGVLSGIHSDPTGEKLDCWRFAGFGSHVATTVFFCLFAGFHPSNGRAIWHIAYIFMFGTGLEPGQVAGTLDMRSCAPSISTWHFGTLLRPPGNLKWGPNAYPTKKPSPTKLHMRDPMFWLYCEMRTVVWMSFIYNMYVMSRLLGKPLCF